MAIGLTALQAGASAIPLIYQGILAAGQKKKAKALEQERPAYHRPGEIIDATTLARQAYMDPRLPGQALMQDQIMGAGAGQMRAAQESAGGANALLAALGGAGQSQQQSMAQLSMEAARSQERDRQGLIQAKVREAQYADKEFGYNVDEPYRDAMAAKSALEEAKIRNTMGVLQGGASILNATSLFAGQRKAPPTTTGANGSMFSQQEQTQFADTIANRGGLRQGEAVGITPQKSQLAYNLADPNQQYGQLPEQRFNPFDPQRSQMNLQQFPRAAPSFDPLQGYK